MQEEYVEFGEFLRNMRQSLGWDYAQMAEKLGVHRTSIGRWERGQRLSTRDIYELELQIRNIVKTELQNRRKLQIKEDVLN